MYSARCLPIRLGILYKTSSMSQHATFEILQLTARVSGKSSRDVTIHRYRNQLQWAFGSGAHMYTLDPNFYYCEACRVEYRHVGVEVYRAISQASAGTERVMGNDMFETWSLLGRELRSRAGPFDTPTRLSRGASSPLFVERG